MEQEVKLSEITLAICSTLDEYESFIKNDMVIGESKIIEGIALVKKMIREINPITIDDDIENKLLFLINNYRILKESKMQVINHYTLYGIDNSCNIISMYLKEQKRTNGKSRVLINN
ncbi:MAG: hypothetical protein IJZ79_07465 [Bacilli bacterium]|nr:hypothetical protein [Bacilli bacterium]